MREDYPHSHQNAAWAAMLRIRPYSDRERCVLPAGQCDNKWRLLFGPDRSEKPEELPGANSDHHHLCGRLYKNAGRLLLQ
jgi:hypothetical protein